MALSPSSGGCPTPPTRRSALPSLMPARFRIRRCTRKGTARSYSQDCDHSGTPPVNDIEGNGWARRGWAPNAKNPGDYDAPERGLLHLAPEGCSMSSTAHKLPPVLYVLGDESGSFRQGDWMVVGLLLLSDPAARRLELAALRAKHQYARELKYGSNDKLRLPYALAVLAWFFETPDVEFRCIAKCGDEFDLAHFNFEWRGLNPETLAYNYIVPRSPREGTAA
jgi:hypothetical protein